LKVSYSKKDDIHPSPAPAESGRKIPVAQARLTGTKDQASVTKPWEDIIRPMKMEKPHITNENQNSNPFGKRERKKKRKKKKQTNSTINNTPQDNTPSHPGFKPQIKW
jgi:hypothetical protein